MVDFPETSTVMAWMIGPECKDRTPYQSLFKLAVQRFGPRNKKNKTKQKTLVKSGNPGRDDGVGTGLLFLIG